MYTAHMRRQHLGGRPCGRAIRQRRHNAVSASASARVCVPHSTHARRLQDNRTTGEELCEWHSTPDRTRYCRGEPLQGQVAVGSAACIAHLYTVVGTTQQPTMQPP